MRTHKPEGTIRRAHATLIIEPARQKRQSGMVLVTSLIFLVVLTLIGVTAMRTTTLQERMAGNLHDADLAFQAAETGLRDGEEWLYNDEPFLPPTNCPVTCDSMPAKASDPEQPNADEPAALAEWDFAGKWAKYGRPATTASASLAAVPRFIVEYEGFSHVCPGDSKGGGGRIIDPSGTATRKGSHYFQVSSASVGGSSVAGSEKPRRILQSVIAIPDC